MLIIAGLTRDSFKWMKRLLVQVSILLFSFCFGYVCPSLTLMLDYMTEIANDISRRNESKGIWGMIAISSPNKSVVSHNKMIVPQNIYLSLKNDFYRENLFAYFHKLGTKTESQRDSDEEKRVKEEAYNFFKTSGGKLVKHNDWKKPELGYYEVDDEYARRSKCTCGYFSTVFTPVISSC